MLYFSEHTFIIVGLKYFISGDFFKGLAENVTI